MGTYEATVPDPYEYLTDDEMAIVKEHYNLVKGCRSQEETERALKGWSEQQRRIVVKLHERIRANGSVIAGLYPSGSLRFIGIVKSPTDQIMALSDANFLLYRQGKIKFVDGRLTSVD
jgi:hypothetical protein